MTNKIDIFQDKESQETQENNISNTQKEVTQKIESLLNNWKRIVLNPTTWFWNTNIQILEEINNYNSIYSWEVVERNGEIIAEWQGNRKITKHIKENHLKVEDSEFGIYKNWYLVNWQKLIYNFEGNIILIWNFDQNWDLSNWLRIIEKNWKISQEYVWEKNISVLENHFKDWYIQYIWEVAKVRDNYIQHGQWKQIISLNNWRDIIVCEWSFCNWVFKSWKYMRDGRIYFWEFNKKWDFLRWEVSDDFINLNWIFSDWNLIEWSMRYNDENYNSFEIKDWRIVKRMYYHFSEDKKYVVIQEWDFLESLLEKWTESIYEVGEDDNLILIKKIQKNITIN